MKLNIIVILSIVILTVMGGSLYWIFQNAPQYQAQSAQRMKDQFLAAGDLQITTSTPGEILVFPADPAGWNFEVQGGTLKVQPPFPIPMPALEPGQKLQDSGVWHEMQKSLTQQLKVRLGIDPKSTAKQHILPPQQPAPAQ